MAKRIVDISVPVRSGMPGWPGDPPVRLERLSSLEAGDAATVTFVHMCAHSGTHVDAPCHFGAGPGTTDDLPLDALIGEAFVVEAGDDGPEITAAEVEPARGAARVLVKSRNSALWRSGRFEPGFRHLSDEAARALVGWGARLVGVDYLSVDGFGDGAAGAHRILLGAGVVVLEGLDLSAAAPGRWELLCLPLRLASCDGAPARAVLLRREDG